MRAIYLIALAAAAAADRKTKYVDIRLPLLLLIVGTIKRCLTHTLITGAAGLIPGILLLVLSGISREAIGYGDGFWILAGGMVKGFWEITEELLLGFLFCGVVSAVLLLFRKKQRKDRIAWLPFLLLADGIHFFMK